MVFFTKFHFNFSEVEIKLFFFLYYIMRKNQHIIFTLHFQIQNSVLHWNLITTPSFSILSVTQHYFTFFFLHYSIFFYAKKAIEVILHNLKLFIKIYLMLKKMEYTRVLVIWYHWSFVLKNPNYLQLESVNFLIEYNFVRVSFFDSCHFFHLPIPCQN